jgi:hypothetical protein
VTLIEGNVMKIIQIIDSGGIIFGLCDEGQVWELSSDRSRITQAHNIFWELVKIPHFVRRNSGSEVTVIQDNYIK